MKNPVRIKSSLDTLEAKRVYTYCRYTPKWNDIGIADMKG